MLQQSVKHAVAVLGRVGVAADQLLILKSSKIDRLTKEEARQCILASSVYAKPSTSGLEKVKKMIAKSSENNELTSRTAAFAAGTALRLKQFKDVDELLHHAALCPTIILNSIRISSHAAQGQVDEALDVLESVLIQEELHFRTHNYSVCEESLNNIHDAIKKLEEDGSVKMKRFRKLQRLITKYNRRCEFSIEEVLHSPVEVGLFQHASVDQEVDHILTDTVVGEMPHFLSKSTK